MLGAVKAKPFGRAKSRGLDGPCARRCTFVWSGRKDGSAGVEPKDGPDKRQATNGLPSRSMALRVTISLRATAMMPILRLPERAAMALY